MKVNFVLVDFGRTIVVIHVRTFDMDNKVANVLLIGWEISMIGPMFGWQDGRTFIGQRARTGLEKLFQEM